MIKIENLHFTYQDKFTLHIDNLQLNTTGLYSLIGANGAGKTTLLKILAGLLTYNTGSIEINNKELKYIDSITLSSLRSYIPQNLYINFPFDIEQFIGFGLYRNMNILSHLNNEDKKRMNGIIEILNLQSIRKKKIKEISGGELQKVHIARALFQNTNILLLDEPVSNIDIHYKFKIFELLKEFSKNKLILYITHDINIALNYSEKIISLKNGNLIGVLSQEETIKHFSKIYEGDFEIEKVKNKFILIGEK